MDCSEVGFAEGFLYPIAKAMSSLRLVGTAALSPPRCFGGVRTIEGKRPYPCGQSFFETVLGFDKQFIAQSRLACLQHDAPRQELDPPIKEWIRILSPI
jgi:hypothetical protein